MGEVWNIPHVHSLLSFPSFPPQALSCLSKLKGQMERCPPSHSETFLPGLCLSADFDPFCNVTACSPACCCSAVSRALPGISTAFCAPGVLTALLLCPSHRAAVSPRAPRRTPFQLRKQRRGTKRWVGEGEGRNLKGQLRFKGSWPSLQSTPPQGPI